MLLCYHCLYYYMIGKNTWPGDIKTVINQTHCKICFLYNKLQPHLFPTCIYNFFYFFLWEHRSSGTLMPLMSSPSNYLSSPSGDSHPEVRFSSLKINFQQSSNETGQRDTWVVTLRAQMFNRDKFKFHSGNSLAFELTKSLAHLATEYPQQIHFWQFVCESVIIKTRAVLF